MNPVYSSMNRGQRGTSFPGLLTWLVVIILMAILGIRLIPAYIEFSAVKRALVAIANDTELRNASVHEIRQAFNKRAAVDEIKSVNGNDIVIRKQDGQFALDINYTVTKPLFANLSLLIDFDATSDR